MATVNIRNISTPINLTNNSNAINPLSFQDWALTNIGIAAENALSQYQEYVLNFQVNKQKKIENNYSLKNDYISLLKKLKILFKNDEEFDRLTNIDFSDEKELSIAIPYYARKLKEIALYYSKQREILKNTKLKYSLVGSTNALEKILYEYILNAFTKKDYNSTIQDKEIFKNVPELSAISKDFSIQIKELYDMNNYYGEDNQLYSLTSSSPLLFSLENYIKNFYLTDNITDIPLSGLSNPLSVDNNCEIFGNINEQILQNIGEKYVGNDLYFLTGGYYDWDITPQSLNLLAGNNFFYWFNGEYVREIPDGDYLDLALSSINWTNATGSTGINTSDIIFVNVGNVITQGAWLQNNPFYTTNINMSATMTDFKSFKFPYPGIGLSGEGLVWSGPTITDLNPLDRRFFPSEKALGDTQEAIKDLYWAETTSISSSESILLQDTSLYDCGAYASDKFNNADKITVRRTVGNDHLHDVNPNGVFNGDLEISWLYKFSQTQLPIKTGNNNIYYPLTAFNDSSDLTFVYDSGETIALSAIDVGNSFAGAVAGTSIATADMLIKLNSVCGPEIEAAWLKGVPLSSLNAANKHICSCEDNYTNYYTGWEFDDGSIQPALSFHANVGSYIKFVWTGPKTNLNDITAFTGFEHDDSCEYKKSQQFHSLLDTNFLNKTKKNQLENWKKCTCKAVRYSPLGHKGKTIDQFKIVPDFIYKDAQFPATFSINTWTDDDSKNYKNSKDLAWFRADNILEPDIGWGTGQWLNNNDEPFYLNQGEIYVYYRSDINHCGFDLPDFIVNSGYCSCVIIGCGNIDCIPVWTKAILNNGVWTDTGTISDMVISPNTFLTYKHQNNYNFTKSRLTYNNNFLTGNIATLHTDDSNIGKKIETVNCDAINFTIKIDLFNNKPYWGEASYDNTDNTQHKLLFNGTANSKHTYDYLQISQPNISKTILNNNDVLEYQSSECGNCFVWIQPITFDVQDGEKRWNKIELNSCVKSEVLDYLLSKSCDSCNSSTIDDVCSCITNCYTTKVGATATNIPSDIILNTQLSGIPVFVNYFARNPYTLNFEVTNITNGFPPNGGLWIPAVSSMYVKAQSPWKNIINDFYPKVATVQSSSLSSLEQLGLFEPSKISTRKYELNAGNISLDTTNRNVNSFDLFRIGNYVDGDFTAHDYNSDKLKIRGFSETKGLPINKFKQTFYPYTTNYEIQHNYYGLNFNNNDYSPWNSNGEWTNSDKYPFNFRSQPLVNGGNDAWYNSQTYLTGNVRYWKTDIYSNEYFLIFNEADTNHLKNPLTYGNLYVKNNNGDVYPASVALSSINEKYQQMSTIYNDSLSGLFSEMPNQGIKHIDVFYNTLVIDYKLSNGNEYVIIENLKFDYDSGIFKNTDDQKLLYLGNNGSTVPFYSPIGNTFIGNILIDNKKKILICGLSSMQNSYIPSVYEYDINSQEIELLYPKNVDEWKNVNFGTILSQQKPLVSYDNEDKSLDFIYRTIKGANEHLINVQLKIDNKNIYTNNLVSLSSISTNSNNFNFVKFQSWENNKILIAYTSEGNMIPLRL